MTNRAGAVTRMVHITLFFHLNVYGNYKQHYEY
jgi:hypothetical protein